jgi:regulatory protein SWI5
VQETQSHRPSDQPGYLPTDFHTHVQQQLNGNVTPTVVAPTPTHPNQEQALQELQHHLEWYQNNFGHSPVPTITTSTNLNLTHLNQPVTADMSFHPVESQTHPIINMPSTPVSHGHSRTVPNTPQHHAQTWPSPPPANGKHIRSQSFQYDVAPMPTSFEATQVMKTTSSPYNLPQDSFGQDSFTVNDQGYASSVYSSSAIDPMSPGRQPNIGGMPTLFEEPLPGDGYSGDALLQAAAGASDDFNSPNFLIGGITGALSPRTAMLHNLGEDVNASIIDTGIPPEQIDAYLTPQDPITKGWSCLFVDPDHRNKVCNKFFKRKENARSHVQNHLNDRQFQCNDCGKTFVRQHDMKRHAAIHKDDRPHVCPCGSGFARHDALTRHRQRGMCEGALPGYEKNEEDKPKRGRPKKQRPDMETRVSKAKKSRKLDHDAIAAASYASSHSSAMSENGLPVTPPDSSDYIEPENFISFAQTPPTSPPSPQKSNCISPAELFTLAGGDSGCGSFAGVSSPETGFEGHDDFNFGAIEAQPGAAQQSLFSDPFSPEYSSLPASSPPSGDDEMEMHFQQHAPMNDVVFGAGFGELVSPMGEGGMAAMLDRWISAN